MIYSLKDAHRVLEAYPNTSKEAETVKRAVDGLEDRWWIQLQKRLWQWVGNYPLLSAIPMAYSTLLLCWLVCYWLRPLWLYRINEAIKPYTDFALPKELGGVKVPVRYVLLVGFFHYSHRVLDTWVTQHLATARREFQRKTTVSERAVHLPIPVSLNGHEIAHLTVKKLRPTFNQSRACLLIWGEGGVGKTSLACQVARWAMADMPSDRLCAEHPMLPVWIEQPLELKDKEHPHPFMDALRGELRALTHE
jgi:hypothetical protein